MFEILIDEFGRTKSKRFDREKTVFDICRFPHYEIVISNILAYFLDSSEDHGFGYLFPKSLFEAAGYESVCRNLQFNVLRECQTESGKYIDILLHNDEISVVIENKIYASLNNDLEDYYRHAKKFSTSTIGIVLSVFPQNLKDSNFRAVTHLEFVAKIRANLGAFISGSKTNRLPLLLDLLTNLENLTGGENVMDTTFLKFVQKHQTEITDLNSRLKALRDEFRRVINSVNVIVQDNLHQANVRQWAWRDLNGLTDVAVSDISTSNNVKIAIDSILSCDGWEFQVFFRPSSNSKINISKFCTECGIPGKESDNARFIVAAKLPIDSERIDVAKFITNLIEKINMHSILANNPIPC